MKRLYFAVLLLAMSNIGHSQAQQSSLLVTRIYGVTSSWVGECAQGVLDNRSTTSRRLNYHAIYATGSGSWTADIQYSDVACTGPFTSFGSGSQISQVSGVPIGSGFGYHPYIKIVVTGAATVTYSGEKDFFIGSAGGGGGGGVTFPITVSQGGTNATTASGARTNLGAAASGSNSDITALTGLVTPLSPSVIPAINLATSGVGGVTGILPTTNMNRTGTATFVAVATSVPADGCASWASGILTTSGSPCGTGSGGVTSVFGRSGVVTAQSGDYAANQISGLAPSATTDTTNAVNISTGTLNILRLPAFVGDVTSSAGTNTLTLNTVNASPGTCGDATHVSSVTVNGKGLVTGCTSILIGSGVTSFNTRVGAVVPTTGDYSASQITGLAPSATIDTTNASNISTGLLALARGGTAANLSATGGASQVLKQVSVGAAITVGQLGASDITGLAASATTDTTNATNITSGTLDVARLSNQVVLKNASNAYSTGAQDFTNATSLKIPNSAGASPTTSALLAYDTTANVFVGGAAGNKLVLAYFIGSAPTSGNCVQWSSGYALSDAGAPCGVGGGGGTVTSVFGRTGAVTAQTGDYSASQISGLAASATIDTTNASNISSGTLPAARLPNPTSGTLGGIQSYAAVAHQWINAISTSGVPSSTQPAASDISGLAASATTDTTNASNISSGILAVARGGTGANLSATGGASQVLKQASTGAAITVGQLSASDISGLAASATIDTTNASNISSGTLSGARLPNPGASSKGGVQSKDCTATSQIVGGINTDSTVACVNISSLAGQWTVSGSNIYYSLGNVGVGSSTTFYPLDVSGSAGAGGAQGAARFTSSTTDTGIHLVNTNTSGRDWVLFSSGGSSGIGAGNFTIFDQSAGGLGYRLSITPSGKVGINTTTPAQQLSVAGMIETTSGGLKFPDGTIQTTAATGGGGSPGGSTGNIQTNAGGGSFGGLNLTTQVSGTVQAKAPTSSGGCGLAGDGSTDDSANFISCVNAASDRAIEFACGVYILSNVYVGNGNSSTAASTINDVSLIGHSAGWGKSNSACVVFKYPAGGSTGAGTYVFRTKGSIQGLLMSGIMIDASNRASRGLWADSCNECRFENMGVTGAAGVGDAQIWVESRMNSVSVGHGCFTSWNNITVYDLVNTQTEGVRFDSTLNSGGTADSCSNHWYRLQITAGGKFPGYGLHIDNTDNFHLYGGIFGFVTSTAVSSLSVSGGVATITTSAPHGLSGSGAVWVGGAPNSVISGNHWATSTSTTTMTFSTSAANGSYTATYIQPVSAYFGPGAWSSTVYTLNTDAGVHWQNSLYPFPAGSIEIHAHEHESGGVTHPGQMQYSAVERGTWQASPFLLGNAIPLRSHLNGNQDATVDLLQLTGSNDVSMTSAGWFYFRNSASTAVATLTSAGVLNLLGLSGSGSRAVCTTAGGDIYAAAGTTCP